MRNGMQRSCRPAFTMIELVTVIAILGIVAVFVGGPTLSYVDAIRARTAASRLSGDIRYLQRTALSAGLRTWIVFSTADNNYRLYVEDPANPGKANRLPAMHPLDQSTGAVQFGSGPFINVAITSVSINGTSELEFDTFGVPYDANGIPLPNSGTISLSSGTSVIVRPVGGLVERAG